MVGAQEVLLVGSTRSGRQNAPGEAPFPTLVIPIAEIDAPELLGTLRAIERRDALEPASKTRIVADADLPEFLRKLDAYRREYGNEARPKALGIDVRSHRRAPRRTVVGVRL